ncbi:Zinc metalloproteinase nas-15 [Armadillidium nasatum]|uniref:Metalloendopeptidase n=1 Tax=Armadillidium nasatum TaxID=96803 RepID=A0A5N5TB79_9CRUS|nr:Zinc metalloproteinase nas-15 [Armadillidium nasatum]
MAQWGYSIRNIISIWCSSAVGRVGGQQTVTLGRGCIYFGIVIHELMHATGFWHEQSRADRDNFITIIWNNIQKGMEYNFQKYDWNIIQNLGVTYDTGSIMHYGSNSFAVDRKKPTIVANNGDEIGQRTHLSPVGMMERDFNQILILSVQ